MNTYHYNNGMHNDNSDNWGSVEECYEMIDCLGTWLNFESQGDTWEEYANRDDITTPVNYFNGTLYGDFQTSNAVSAYGLYDMMGNLSELVSIDAACYDAYNECGAENDPENQPVNSIGISGAYKYLAQRTHYSHAGGYNSMNNYHSMFSVEALHNGGYSYTKGFRCARTITGN